MPNLRLFCFKHMRLGEILSIKWDKIDFGRGFVALEKSKNDPEFELVRLSDGNAVRRRSLV